jgi:hypothetical protein
MITNTPVFSTALTDAYQIFKATDTGATGGTAERRAVTTIILCNTGSVTLTDETINQSTVNIYIVDSSKTGYTTPGTYNLVASNLIIPAGETFFFSEERVVLDDNDSIHVSCTSGGTITAGSFVVGANYKILTLGTTTNWNTVAATSTQRSWGGGSASVGDTFTATAAGSGDGTAILCLLTATVSSLEV